MSFENAQLITIAIVAVEKSGDAIAAELIRSLKKTAKKIDVVGVCGPEMRLAGCKALGDIEDLSVMGIVDVALNYPRLKKLQRRLIEKLLKSKVDCFIGVDGPAFNLGIGRQLKKRGVYVAQYVCPQAWAWRENRIGTIRKSVNKMFALFPFEERFFLERGVDTQYVGHPIADSLDLIPKQAHARDRLNLKNSDTVVALMPGSRLSEIERHAQIFLKTGQAIRDSVRENVQILVGCSSSRNKARIAHFSNEIESQLICGDSRTVLTAADVALVVSGTVSLESLLCGTPAVVAYKTSFINYHILKTLIKIQYVSLPNILSETNLVPELLQHEVNVKNLTGEVIRWLSDTDRRNALFIMGRSLHRTLKINGSDRVAETICEVLENGRRPYK